MLKSVVFPVTAYFYKPLLEKREKIEAELLPYGIEPVLIELADSKDTISGMVHLQDKELYLKEEMLLITDSPKILKELLADGFYAIALYHEQNRGISFETPYAVEDVEQLNFKSYDEVYRRLAGLPWDILETERLKVRESVVSDIEDFYRIYREPSVTYYMEDLFQDPEEERAYMESYIRQVYGFYGFGMWTVLCRETGKVIGRAGLSVREGYDVPELGFVIDVHHQRQGYGYEVCSAILVYAGKELLFEKVQALVQKGNTASRQLLDRLGFQYEKDVVENKQEYQLMIRQL